MLHDTFVCIYVILYHVVHCNIGRPELNSEYVQKKKKKKKKCYKNALV